MLNTGNSSFKAGRANRIVRILVALLFLIAVPLNAFAMNSSGLISSGVMSSSGLTMMQMEEHGHHDGADVSNCQMMTQCTAAMSGPDRFDLSGVLLKSELILPPQIVRARVVAPPFHPPIH
ncbi:hypothetical protein MNBD_ALPHA12-1877 [hydrothermal vent metagenome]|uniref:DUF2946 domain-containing protein n=1 Tax=hydrothermal vent metagenome TaxID=652676 RepID=A0A3B0TS70_9ZZZZ